MLPWSCRVRVSNYYICIFAPGLYPGVKKILLKLNLKGYKTAIVTSKEKSRAQRILKRFKIPINNINCPNKKYRGKPFPDQILEFFDVS